MGTSIRKEILTGKKIGVVLYANPDYYPPTVNAVRLLSRQFEVVLIGRNYDPPDCEYPENVKVWRLGQYTTLSKRMAGSVTEKIWEYIRFIVKSHPLLADASLIYAYDAFGYIAAYLVRLFLKHKPPLIYQNHEISESLSPLTSLTGWIQRAEKRFIHAADLVVFPDQDRATYFQKQTNLSQQPVIVPNFPLSSYFVLPQHWLQLIDTRWQSLTLFYRGWISDTSSMKEMVSATALSRAMGRDIQLRVVGFIHDDIYAELKQWVEHEQISDRFSYLGVLPYQDLQEPTFAASIGFALYKNTSFDRVACASACNKIYEYAACGLPVIVSDFPTYRNYLEKEPWVRFANPDDPNSILLAIQNILKDFESYKAICLSARAAFEEKFNYESVFTPLLKNIETLVA